MYLKMATCGGEGGREWDDDVYEGVRKVYVGQDLTRITYVKFEYVKEDGVVVTQEHGTVHQSPKEFVLDFPGEYIKSVETTYDKPYLCRNTVITSLKFETSKGRTSFFGYEVGKKFVLKQKDRRLVGFHGRVGDAIDALGAYFAPIPAPTPLIPAKKLPVVGGNGGVAWDDGVYDGVRRIYIGQC